MILLAISVALNIFLIAACCLLWFALKVACRTQPLPGHEPTQEARVVQETVERVDPVKIALDLKYEAAERKRQEFEDKESARDWQDMLGYSDEYDKLEVH